MIKNNLNRKDNIKRANQFVKSIKKYPCELVRINYSFDASTSNYEKITNQEIEFIIGNTLDFIKKILGENYQKTGVVMFPDFEWDSNQFSNIIALDVFEHIEDSKGFLRECNRLMVKGGHLIIQSPIILTDGQMDEKMFNGLEHIWIYGIEDMKALLIENGFIIYNIQRHQVGHEQVTAVKI